MSGVRHVEVFEGRDGKGRFRVVGANGQKMDASQGYSRRSNARRAARNLYPDLPIETVEE